jgi:hypothetical protein
MERDLGKMHAVGKAVLGHGHEYLIKKGEIGT